MNVATIEIGSRSIRLLVADVSTTGDMEVIETAWDECRLAEKVSAGGAEQHLNSITSRVQGYREQAQRAGAQQTLVFGTATLRSLAQDPDIDIARYFGDVRVLSQEEEARCSLRAAALGQSVPKDSAILAIDLGSGSLEIALGFKANNSWKILCNESHDLGSNRLASLLKLKGYSIRAVREEIAPILGRIDHVDISGKCSTFLLGGVATNATWVLAAREDLRDRYHPSRVHGKSFSTSTLDEWFSNLARSFARFPAKTREYVNPRTPNSGEVEVLLGGLAVLSDILQRLDQKRFTTCGYGTRYGVIAALGKNEAL